MLYEFTVFKEMRNKRKKVFSSQVTAANPVNALERACIRLAPDRIIEIRQVDDITKPKVTRIERDGVV